MGFLSSPRRRRQLAWSGGVAGFLGGLVAFVVLYPEVERPPEVISDEPAVVVTTPEKVPLTKDVKQATIAAGNLFLDTAVKRENPERSWDVVHPLLREGYTKRDWASGEIPIVPYPVDSAIYRLDYSHADLVGWKVSVYPPKGSPEKAMTFYMDVRLSGTGESRRWRVSNWSPASILASAGGGPASADGGGSPFAIGRNADAAKYEGRIDPTWLLLVFAPLGLLAAGLGAKGVRDWRRRVAVERSFRERG